MVVFRRIVVCGVLLGVVGVLPMDARAGMFRNVVRGLDYAGFQFFGQENPISGGAEFALGRTFNDETLDFGPSDLTLTGPINFAFSTGGRHLPVLDFSLSTNDQAFQYIFNSSTGAQDYRVEGNFLLDATGSINTFGFYDVSLQLSSRQDVFLDGRFQDGMEQELDYDIGPIDVSGNIFADLLSWLFDPMFEALGVENIFDSLSGRAQAMDLMQLLVADTQAAINTGNSLTTMEAAGLSENGNVFRGLDDNATALAFADQPSNKGLASMRDLPEPGVGLLLLGPIVYLIARGRRGRLS